MPTHTGARSSSVMSGKRMICGVSVSTRSMSLLTMLSLRKSRPSHGISPSSGVLTTPVVLSRRMRPANMLDSPLLRRITEVMVRVPMVMASVSPTLTVSPTFEISTLRSRVISRLWWTRGSTSIWMPISLYWKEVMGTTLPPMVFEVLKLVTGIGTWSPISRLAFSPSVTRSCGCASTWASPEDLARLMRTEGTLINQSPREMFWKSSRLRVPGGASGLIFARSRPRLKL